jgi:hypothetical protein
MNKPEKKIKKFVSVAKVDNTKFVKYRFNDINKYIEFQLRKWPDTRFINIFSNKGADKRKLLYTYGRKKGLEPSH